MDSDSEYQSGNMELPRPALYVQPPTPVDAKPGDLFSNYDQNSLYSVPSTHKESFGNSTVLPPTSYNSPYYTPFTGSEEPRPVDQLIRRFRVWKMLIKQVIFYLKEMSIFKKQVYMGDKAMLENLEVLKKQNAGRLRLTGQNAAQKLKKSFSSPDLTRKEPHMNGGSADPYQDTAAPSSSLDRFIQDSFLPPGDHSIMSIASTLFNYHSAVSDRELVTHSQLTLKLVPRLENLKESLNETIRQLSSLRGTSSDFSTHDLKTEIAKTGAILSDYICSVELLTKGETKTSLGTTVKFNKVDESPPDDPYLLRLKLDLQLKDQLFTEAHLKESYMSLERKAVQLETILYTELQSALGTYSNLVNAELDSAKDNLVADFTEGLLRQDPHRDWDYFISNDSGTNLLPLTAKQVLSKEKHFRKKSDIIYPYAKDRISCCIMSGYLEKKSKYLKNYSRLYYVLTCNYLHEFKTNNRKNESRPLNSYAVDDIKVSPFADDPCRFVIRVHPKSESKSKYTFRCQSEEVANHWLDCLADLCSFSDILERNRSFQSLESSVEMHPSASAASSIADYQSHTTGQSSSLESKSLTMHLNDSSSSLHLPTFRRIKPSPGGTTTANSAAATGPHTIASSNSASSLEPTSPAIAALKSPASIKSNGSNDSAEMGDYFSYTAPRPRLIRGRSSNAAAARLRSRSPSPSAAGRPTRGIQDQLTQLNLDGIQASAMRRRRVLESQLAANSSSATNLAGKTLLNLPDRNGHVSPPMDTPGIIPQSTITNVFTRNSGGPASNSDAIGEAP